MIVLLVGVVLIGVVLVDVVLIGVVTVGVVLVGVVLVGVVIVGVLLVVHLAARGSVFCRCWRGLGPAAALCGGGGSPAPCPHSPDRRVAAHLHKE